MASDEVMKNYFARFIGHEMMFMVFSSDFHGIFTNLSFIVLLVLNCVCFLEELATSSSFGDKTISLLMFTPTTVYVP